jgi:hypothetical protein
VAFKQVENGLSLDLVLAPVSSRFVVFRNKSSGQDNDDLTTDLQFGLAKKKTGKPIDLSNNWQLSFEPEMGGPGSHEMEALNSWSDSELEGIKYYSGTVTYTREFSIREGTTSEHTEVFVTFEDIQEMGRVFINGQDCGIVWTPPYTVNITPFVKPGINQIALEVVNTWNNRIVGDLRNPDKPSYTQTNAKSKFSKESPLLKSGLLGKAEIFFTN